MRINNVEYPNVSIRVVESRRIVGLTDRTISSRQTGKFDEQRKIGS